MEGARNIRELGGYPAEKNKTHPHRYLRGDGVERLTGADCEMLYQHGVRVVVDLRCRSEWIGRNLPLLGYRDMVYVSVPLLDDVIEAPSVDDFPESLGVQYVRLLERYKDKIRTIFGCFSGQVDRCVLFHCTAGKDRTGVIAMLLLMLAEVPEEFIVADYARTEQYVRQMMDARILELAGQGIVYPEHVFRTHPDNIRTAMRHIQERYGGSHQYLLDCGVQEHAIQRIRKNFIGES